MAKRKTTATPKKVDKPIIPRKELPGYCRVCAGHSFKLRFSERELTRTCNTCGDKLNL